MSLQELCLPSHESWNTGAEIDVLDQQMIQNCFNIKVVCQIHEGKPISLVCFFNTRLNNPTVFLNNSNVLHKSFQGDQRSPWPLREDGEAGLLLMLHLLQLKALAYVSARSRPCRNSASLPGTAPRPRSPASTSPAKNDGRDLSSRGSAGGDPISAGRQHCEFHVN